MRLGSLLELISDGTHQTPEYKESGVLFLSVQNISGGYFDLSKVKYISQETHDELCKRIKPQNRDILLCRIGTLGKPIIVDVDYEFSIFVSLGLLRLIDQRMAEWVVASIDSPIGFQWIQRVKVGGGTHTFKINLGDIPSFLIPLPPYKEQLRIQKKLVEILDHVKEYEKKQDARERLDAELPERLRKSILQEAVRGRLVPQDPSDEPASALLGRIRAERASLVKAGKLKAPKGGESVIYRGSDGGYYEKRGKGEPQPVVVPFDIPESWAWARLGSIVLNRVQTKPTSDFCYIDIGSIDNSRLSLNNTDTVIAAKDAPSRARKPVAMDDVLYSTVRPYLHNVCIVDREFSHTPIASTGFAVMVCPTGFSESYLLRVLISPFFDAFSNDNENSKGVAYPAINDARLYSALIPVPPADEQCRIVLRIQQLEESVS